MVVAAGPSPEAVVPQRVRARRHLAVPAHTKPPKIRHGRRRKGGEREARSPGTVGAVPVDGDGGVRVRVLALDVGAGAPVAEEVAAHLDVEVVVPPPLPIGVPRAGALPAAPAPGAAAAAAAARERSGASGREERRVGRA